MVKNFNKYNDEIDILDVIKIFWDNKAQIILIIFVSIIIGFIGDIFNGKNQVSYQGSLEIKQSRNSEFDSFYSITKFLKEYDVDRYLNSISNGNENDNPYKINGETALEGFINLFLEYRLLISVIEKIPSINEEISKLSEEDRMIRLFQYAKLFTFEHNPAEKNYNYILNFKWDDLEEAREILTQTLDLVKKEYTQLILNDLDSLAKSKKDYILKKNISRIEFLEEQAKIAKELNIIDSVLKEKLYNIPNNDDTGNQLGVGILSVNINSNDYYLRGVNTIEKEIDIIKNRNYTEFSRISNQIFNIRDNSEINWVDYNLYSLKTELIKDSNNFFKISIILGISTAFFYPIISSVLKTKRRNSIRKKNN